MKITNYYILLHVIAAIAFFIIMLVSQEKLAFCTSLIVGTMYSVSAQILYSIKCIEKERQ